MILLPSIFHGLMGMILIGFLAMSIIFIPLAFGEESKTTWKIKIMKGAGDLNPSLTFYPDELPVSIGDTIEWINTDNVAHSITSGIPDFPDFYGYFFYPGRVEPGESISFKLEDTEQLAFYYLCEIHPWMTGKIFLKDNPASFPETTEPINTEKSRYGAGEVIRVSGRVHNDFWGSEYQLLVFDSDNTVVEAIYGYFEDDASYSETISTKNSNWHSGNYQIQLIYGLPSKVAQLNFEFNELIQQKSIPIWVKTVGEFWCGYKISDIDFVNSIQYLVKKGVIVIEGEESSDPDDKLVPKWVRSNTCWWSDDKISDQDFKVGIEFLINKGLIKI